MEVHLPTHRIQYRVEIPSSTLGLLVCAISSSVQRQFSVNLSTEEGVALGLCMLI